MGEGKTSSNVSESVRDNLDFNFQDAGEMVLSADAAPLSCLFSERGACSSEQSHVSPRSLAYEVVN